MIVVELTRFCVFLDAIYPEGYICRKATQEEEDKFMSSRVATLSDGDIVVYLNGKFRIVPSGFYRIISKSSVG